MVCAPGCSAPCKAFSLNSLPFIGRLQPTSVETRPCNSSYQGSKAAQTPWSPCRKPLLCHSLSLYLLFPGLSPERKYRPEHAPLGSPLTCLRTVSEEWRVRREGVPALLLPPICCVILRKSPSALLLPELYVERKVKSA